MPGSNITFVTKTASCSFLFRLLPVPSHVPIMEWRHGLMLIFMPELIVSVSLPHNRACVRVLDKYCELSLYFSANVRSASSHITKDISLK